MASHEALLAIGKAVFDFLNSNFSTSLLGAAAGAYGGAIASQKILERNQERLRAIAEIGAINKIILNAIQIFTCGAMFKEQQLLEMMKEYKKAREPFIDKALISSGSTSIPLLNLNTLETFKEQPEVIVTLLYEHVDADGKTLQAASMLVRSIRQIEELLGHRNEIIKQFQARDLPPGFEPYQVYFGLANKLGHVDRRYPDIMFGIERAVDNTIWFSKYIAEKLSQLGDERKRRYGIEQVSIRRLSISPEALRLVPADAEFPDWK